MTKRLSLIALLFITLLSACKDDSPAPYKCTECTDEPEANAAYDNSGQGIYKGVLVGSSGTIKFDIANTNSSITGVLVIDGTTITLTTNGTYSASSGFQGSFTGSLNGGTVIIPFNVDASGVFTTSTPTIAGHSGVVLRFFKEKSNQLVEAFEGEFGGGDSGTFNLVLIRNQDGVGQWIALAKSDTNKIFTGQVEDNEIFGGGFEIQVEGKIAGDNVSGEWRHDSNGSSGGWEGKRTL